MNDPSREATVCYFVTSYVLVGVYLAYAMFAQTPHELDVFLLFVLFFTAPPLAFFGGAAALGIGLVTGQIGLALLGLAAVGGACGTWYGAKVAIYGKKRIAPPTP